MNDNRLHETLREAFARYLGSRRLRRTPERFAILEAVVSLSGHFVVENLQERMAENPIKVSRGTLYNTLGLLIDAGLVRRHQFDGQPNRYELQYGRRSHHHLVCTRCGKVREVADSEVDAFLSGRRYDTFSPDRYSLDIYGLCRRCQRKGRRRKGDEEQ